MAKALGTWLVVGAVLTGGVASGIGLHWPFAIDRLTGSLVVLGVWLAIYLLLGILVIGDAIRLTRRGDLDALQESANLVKLIAVPFFVLNFVALTEVVTVAAANDRDRLGLDGITVALLFVILTYLVLLPTSAYGVGCLVNMRRAGMLGPVAYGVNLALHFLYVVDVISTIVVVEIARDRLGVAGEPSRVSRNLLTGVLAVGSSLATVWLAFVAIEYLLRPSGSFLPWGIYVLGFASAAEFVLLVLVPVVPLVALRTAVRSYLRDDIAALGRSARTVKLVMIPLFVQNFVLCAIVVLALTLLPVVITRGAIVFLMGPAGVAFVGAVSAAGFVPAVIGTYLMMLPTSIYGLAWLALLLKQRVVGLRYGALHVLFQLVLVADVIATLVLTRQLTKSRATVPAAEPSELY